MQITKRKSKQCSGACPYPGIDKLVDALYCDEINSYINDICHDELDKKTFIMFVIMYFYIYFGLECNVQTSELSKQNIKLVLSDIIRDPEKRHQCIQLFTQFQKSIGNPELLGTQEVKRNVVKNS